MYDFLVIYWGFGEYFLVAQFGHLRQQGQASSVHPQFYLLAQQFPSAVCVSLFRTDHVHPYLRGAILIS